VYDRILERYGFSIPETYRAMQARDLLTPEAPTYLHLSDLRWYSPSRILEHPLREYEIEGLLPFASSGRGDRWCWHTQWPGPTKAPVVFCPADEDTAEVFAADFTSALYRLLLEEFSGTWLDEPYGEAGVVPRYRAYLTAIQDLLPQPWFGTLARLCVPPLKEVAPGVQGLVSRSEANAIIERDLAFPELNKTFKHHL